MDRHLRREVQMSVAKCLFHSMSGASCCKFSGISLVDEGMNRAIG